MCAKTNCALKALRAFVLLRVSFYCHLFPFCFCHLLYIFTCRLTHFSYSWVAIIYISTKQKAKESIAYGEDIPRLNGKGINTRQDDALKQVSVCLFVFALKQQTCQCSKGKIISFFCLRRGFLKLDSTIQRWGRIMNIIRKYKYLESFL